LKFDHIGVAVPNLRKGRDHLSSTLGIDRWTEEIADEVNGVYVQFGTDRSGICYELIAPLGESSPIAQALKTKRGILNHVAYLVDDLDKQAEHLQGNGCFMAGPAKPAVAYGGRRIQFFVSPLRFIIELIEAPDHQHRFVST
jgi:methylmalonyl-CoA/ethylmalonyl-CoA epimerase